MNARIYLVVAMLLAAAPPQAWAGYVNSPDEDLAHRKWPAPQSQLLQWLPDGAWVSIQRCKKMTNNAPVPAVDGPMQKPRVWCRIKAGGVWGWARGRFLVE